MTIDEKDVKELTEENTDKVVGGSDFSFDVDKNKKQYEQNIYPQGDPKDVDFEKNKKF